jgi:hypothetical protein
MQTIKVLFILLEVIVLYSTSSSSSMNWVTSSPRAGVDSRSRSSPSGSAVPSGKSRSTASPTRSAVSRPAVSSPSPKWPPWRPSRADQTPAEQLPPSPHSIKSSSPSPDRSSASDWPSSSPSSCGGSVAGQRGGDHHHHRLCLPGLTRRQSRPATRRSHPEGRWRTRQPLRRHRETA